MRLHEQIMALQCSPPHNGKTMVKHYRAGYHDAILAAAELAAAELSTICDKCGFKRGSAKCSAQHGL